MIWSKLARLASQFNLAAENNAIMPDDGLDDNNWINDDDDEQGPQITLSAVDILDGSEPVEISHAGGEFYELVRDEIRKLSKCVHRYTILSSTTDVWMPTALRRKITGQDEIAYNANMKDLQRNWTLWCMRIRNGATL